MISNFLLYYLRKRHGTTLITRRSKSYASMNKKYGKKKEKNNVFFALYQEKHIKSAFMWSRLFNFLKINNRMGRDKKIKTRSSFIKIG